MAGGRSQKNSHESHFLIWTRWKWHWIKFEYHLWLEHIKTLKKLIILWWLPLQLWPSLQIHPSSLFPPLVKKIQCERVSSVTFHSRANNLHMFSNSLRGQFKKIKQVKMIPGLFHLMVNHAIPHYWHDSQCETCKWHQGPWWKGRRRKIQGDHLP